MEEIEFLLRPVREDDVPAVARIYNYYILNTTVTFEEEPLSPQQMSARIEAISARFPYYVCVESASGKVVGFCYLHLWKERAAYCRTLEEAVYVDKDYRGRRLGRIMVGRLIEDARAAGAHALIACVTRGNTASEHLHRSLHFRQASCFREVGNKLGQWLDVVDFELILD